MKKLALFLSAALVSGAALAAANDAMVEFSTPGPDAYADGTPVLDGECYALAWTAPGAELAVAADGTATGGEIVLAAPVARGGRCPKVFFEVDAAELGSRYAGGAWGVYLLDTRRWGADGSVRPAGAADGKVRLVNAAGAVPGAAARVVPGAAAASVAGAAAATASAATAVPERVPAPEITGIRVAGARVFVTVRGTVPYLQYGLVSGAAPGAVAERAEGAPRTGAASGDEEIVLVAPARKGSGFFRVGRR